MSVQRASINVVRSCSRCGYRYGTAGEASVCCLFAPEPQGWCAWCGDDLPGRAVFCGTPCALEHATDLALRARPAPTLLS